PSTRLYHAMTITPLSQPITATVAIPGSKSYTNRALLLAALTNNPVTIINPLMSDDTRTMISCLQTLGITITISDDRIVVTGSIADITEKAYELDAHISGVSIRFITALATIIPGTKTIYGKEGLNKRPIKDLVDGLKQLGAEIEYLEKEGFPPIRISSQKLTPGAILLNGEISSQFLSAMLMITPLVGDVSIAIEGDQISKPYIDMTLDTMKNFGVTIENNDYLEYQITKQQYTATSYNVEGDFSSAGYFFAIATLTKSTLTLQNLNPDSKQADKKLLDVLEDMGSKITYEKNAITIQGTGVIPMEIDVTDFPDQAQTLAVLAAFAEGTTVLKGVQSLRIKETERVIAVQNELKKMEIETTATHDTLTIYGGNPKPATIDTYGDHRMAMAFAVAGTKLTGIKINNPEVVSKTFPDFWKKLNGIGIKTENENKTNIVLIGMRGSGKSTIGNLLATKLSKQYVDLDNILEQQENMSVAQIVATHGWNYFRQKESVIAQEFAKKQNMVIATGGGVIVNGDNTKALKQNGTVIFLTASIETLLARIGDDPNRASLTDKKTKEEEMETILNERKNLYEQAADIIIGTTNGTKEELINDIVEKIRGGKNKIICMVIGDPVEHSLSPRIHNAGYKALGLDYVFTSKRVTKDDLSNFIDEIRKRNIKGFSVTLPHKIAIMHFVDEVNPAAKKIGAINTVVNDQGILRGYNTDWIGIVNPLEQRTKLEGKMVAIIGASGAARAAAYGVRSRGAKIQIYNRTVEKAVSLAQEFGGEA
ncbi:MAG TPA: 3-phosphoshikimate 1-carboxyvinyltransferase, partial [Patescibacteria group bacterium]|nr:3-phosphoshikimate 1-carboxyvinyltransferase [Patescibacteria group bacterium]